MTLSQKIHAVAVFDALDFPGLPASHSVHPTQPYAMTNCSSSNKTHKTGLTLPMPPVNGGWLVSHPDRRYRYSLMPYWIKVFHVQWSSNHRAKLRSEHFKSLFKLSNTHESYTSYNNANPMDTVAVRYGISTPSWEPPGPSTPPYP